MIVPRQNHDSDEEELHNAYNELKDEASQVVVWLGKQLADYQSINRAEEIAKAREDSDLESLARSELRRRESIALEI